MAGSIEKRGKSYRLIVSDGYNFEGKQIRYTKTVHGTKREAEIERIYGIVRERGYEPTDRMQEALAYLDYDKSHNKWVLSPNKAAIFVNTSGNSLQGRLRYGSAYGYRTLTGWWEIPTDIVIELWYKQVKKEERLNGNQNS